MKTIRIMLTMLFVTMTCSCLAQGIIIYKSNGTQEKLPYIAIDSIIPYFADKVPEPVEAKPVDLGLPSGTLWASYNVGATAPETHGGYYAYGETGEKLTYSWSSYMCTSEAACGSSSDPLYVDKLLTYREKVGTYYWDLKCNIAGSKYDVATQTWGESWVMPTADQFQELFDNCTRARVKINDVECVEYTGPNGNSLIFPLSGGYKENKDLVDSYTMPTYFWVADFVYQVCFGGRATISDTNQGASNNAYGVYRYYGYQVRPVLKKGAQIPGSGGSSGADGSTIISVADFKAAAETTDVWYQLTGTIKNLKDGDQYGNFDLEDSTGSVYVYGVLSEKGGAKQKFQELVASKGIANGKKITIVGNRGSFNGKIEVLNAYFVKVE